jgi:hypothetical protein
MTEKNIVVFEDGDVYIFGHNFIKPTEWMETTGHTFDEITYIQGPILSDVSLSDLKENCDESDLDSLWDLLYDASRNYDRCAINNVDEYAALALARGVIGNEFHAEHGSKYEVVNEWLMDEYGINEGSPIVTSGVFEINWDEAYDAYDENSGRIMLEGVGVVFVVDSN